MEVWRFIFYKLCGKIQNKYFKKEDRKKRKKQMMMTMKKMKMMMMRRKDEDDEETLIGSSSSPDLETLVGSPSPSSPDLQTRPRTNLIRRIADAVAGLARSVTAAIAGTPDNFPINNVGCTNRDSDNAAEDKYRVRCEKVRGGLRAGLLPELPQVPPRTCGFVKRIKNIKMTP